VARHLDTALFRETRNASGSVARVGELIAAGADVNRRHKCGNTPLWEAAYHGRSDLVAILLMAGADPNICADDGSGPLHWAANNGHLAIVEQLLGCGAAPNALRDSGQSVLAAAISNGHAEIVRRLVEAGAAVDHRYFNRSMPEYAEWCRQPGIAILLRRSRRATP
jgi:ankyrin repeat protein